MLSNWPPKSPRTPARTALALEGLEARDVPATHVWTDLGATNNWSDDGNWTGGAPGKAGEVGAVVVQIPINDASMFQDIPNLTIDQLEFKNSGSALLTLSQPLTINGTTVINNVVNTSGTNTILGTGANELKLDGSLNPFFKATAGTLTVDAVVSGAHDLVLNAGGGVLELAKDNSYTGDTRVNQGILRLNGPVGGGPTVHAGGQLIVGDGSTTTAEAFVQLAAGSQLDPTTAITVATDGVLTLTNGSSNVVGDVTLNGGTLSANTGNLAVANLIVNDDAQLTSSPGGHLNLLNGQHTVTVAAGKTLTVTAPVRNAGGGAVGGIIKTGPGELFLHNTTAGEANSYTGLTEVRDGTLRLNDVAANSAFLGDLTIGDGVGAAGSAVDLLDNLSEIPNTTALTIKGDGKLDLNGHDETVGPLTLAGGAQVTTGVGVLTRNGPVGVLPSNGGTATITGTLNLGTIGNITVQGVADTLLIDAVVSGTGDLNVYGPGAVVLDGSQPNTYTGGTAVFGGTLTLNNDASNLAVSKNVFIGGTPANPAVLRLLQSSEIPNDALVSVTGFATLDLNGHSEAIGKLNLDSVAAVTTGPAGTLTLLDNLSYFSTGSGPATIAGNLNLGGAERTFDVGNGPTASPDVRIDAAVSGGSIKKTGTGVLLLNGVAPGVDVTVLGGTLGGTGSLGNLTAGPGTVAPGMSPGTLTTKAVDLTNGALAVELNGAAAGQFDQLKAVGAVDLTGSALSASLGFTPNPGQKFTIIDNDGTDPVTGTFAGLPDNATPTIGGNTFRIDYDGGTGNDVALTAVLVPGSVRPFAVGAGAGGGNTVRVYNPTGTPKVDVPAFEDNVSGGVRTAVADVNHDGTADLIVGTGPGTVAEVRVFDGATGQRIVTNLPFADFQGGVFVAAADFNLDGYADVIITPDEGGGPRVTVVSGRDGAVLANFFAIDDPNFRGGARAAAGDVSGDGTPDLVVSAGFGGGPRIAIYDGTTLGGTPTKLVGDFFAFEPTLRNGAYAAVGDLNGDGKADLVFGGGPGGGPRVIALDAAKVLQGDMAGATLASFFAGNVANRGGVRVSAANLDGDPLADLVVGDGTGAGSHVTAYLGKNITGSPTPDQSFDAFPGFLGGVFVG
jgi:autotransporter-associated beta strand protein